LGILSLPNGGSTVVVPFGEDAPAMEWTSGGEADEYRRASVPSDAAKIARVTGMKSRRPRSSVNIG
jgi:hypothetical protein